MDFQSIASESGIDVALKDAREISTYRGGGKAYVFLPKNVDEFSKIYKILRDEKKEIFILGGGSNVIVSDGICRSGVISTKAMNNIEICDDFVECESGAMIANVIANCRKHSLGGLEFLSGVPCSIGGATHMNASAFCTQIGDYISKVWVLNADCATNDTNIHEVDVTKDMYGYRQGIDARILKVRLKLDKMNEQKSRGIAREFLLARKIKQPRQPSCGSVFVNGDVPSGKLIEECGMKGTQIGGAQISNIHANFIVNTGCGCANDYLDLANIASRRVFEKFGVWMKREFVVLN